MIISHVATVKNTKKDLYKSDDLLSRAKFEDCTYYYEVHTSDINEFKGALECDFDAYDNGVEVNAKIHVIGKSFKAVILPVYSKTIH